VGSERNSKPIPRTALFAAAALALTLCAASISVVPALAHVKTGDSWTYRYYTRDADSPQCGQASGNIDPLNIIYYQYGEALRINEHSLAETHWYGEDNRREQVMCIDPDADGSWDHQGSVAEEQGHGCLACDSRAHLRIFPAGHVHDELADRWSTADVHHEDLVCCFDHDPDESWEQWEGHYASEFDGHNIYPDYYDRVAPGMYRGEFDNGQVTRIGGLHSDY
jgi:hypothetical protein